MQSIAGIDIETFVNALEFADGGNLIITDKTIKSFEILTTKEIGREFNMIKVRLSDNKYKREVCKKVILAYEKLYNLRYAFDNDTYLATPEVIARFWNGGPFGFQKQKTTEYWFEAKKYLDQFKNAG